MKIAGTHTFPASREDVWAALNDPEVLARAIPGCQKLDQVGENEYESTLKIGQGVVKGVYSGHVRIVDVQAPEHYRIEVDGKGSNGFVKGSGTVDLADAGDGSTKLTYGGDAQVGGTIASVGQRLIDGAAKSLINQSLKALAQQIELRKNGATDGADDTPASAESNTEEKAAAPAAQETPAAGESTQEAAGETADNAAAADTSDEDRDPFVSEAAMNGDDGAAATDTHKGAAAPPATSEDLPATAVPAQHSDRPPPATTTMLSTNPAPPQSRSAAPSARASADDASSFQRRTIVVPESERLSEGAVMQGMITDFISERPWLPWVLVAFLLGILVGRR